MVFYIDIETFSDVDIKSCGAYKYINSEAFEILSVAYAKDDGPVITVSLKTGDTLPDELLQAVHDQGTAKVAHNANFERLCFDRHFGTSTKGWLCSSAKAAYCGLPLGLEMACKAAGLPAEDAKSNGKALIRYFCMPCKPTKTNGQRLRNLPEHDAQKWQDFIDYMEQDVIACRALWVKLAKYKRPGTEGAVWHTDQRINDRGVCVDLAFVEACMKVDEDVKEALTERCKKLTGLANPNSVTQLKNWLEEQTGKRYASLDKENIQELKKIHEANRTLHEVLTLRERMGKTSVKKYAAIKAAAISYEAGVSRVYGLLQYYGAFRTGRWAGRLVQVQNLPRNHAKNLADIRATVATGDADLCDLLYGGKVQEFLSQLIRTAFVAPVDKMLVASDFSAIEARVLAWLAGQKWRLEVFATHGKIYEASASQMFRIPIESIGKDSDYRQRGKVAELALGYQGGVGALKTMGGEKLGMNEVQMLETVTLWRAANPNIVRFWKVLETSAVAALQSPGRTIKSDYKGITFLKDDFALRVKLPSGRELFYPGAKLDTNQWGRASIKYKGLDERNQWVDTDTYGGKLCENIVQAVARDLLAEALVRLENHGFDTVMHVHDEAVVEVNEATAKEQLDFIDRLMAIPPQWADGLPLRADGFVTKFYKKD